jgi:hypothetical protein
MNRKMASISLTAFLRIEEMPILKKSMPSMGPATAAFKKLDVKSLP